MNDREKADLDFLLTADPDVLLDWYSKMDAGDIDYALDLLRRAYEEGMGQLDDINTKDLTQAKNLLAQFML